MFEKYKELKGDKYVINLIENGITFLYRGLKK